MAEGYAKVAHLMCHSHEHSIARIFRSLQVENLLLFQAELVQLDSELQELVDRDCASRHFQQRLYHKDWWSLKHSADFGNDEQLKKRLELRAVLKEYNECLAQQAFLSSSARPQHSQIRFLDDWLRDPEMGRCPISSRDRDALSPVYEKDLIQFHGQQDYDALFRWLTKSILPTYHLWFGKRLHEPQVFAGVANYDDSAIQRALDIFLTVMSSLFPVASITLLNYISDMAARLTIIATTTATFSLCLAFATSAKRVEIFAATTAQVPLSPLQDVNRFNSGTHRFAAVEVVFIGTNNVAP